MARVSGGQLAAQVHAGRGAQAASGEGGAVGGGDPGASGGEVVDHSVARVLAADADGQVGGGPAAEVGEGDGGSHVVVALGTVRHAGAVLGVRDGAGSGEAGGAALEQDHVT